MHVIGVLVCLGFSVGREVYVPEGVRDGTWLAAGRGVTVILSGAQEVRKRLRRIGSDNERRALKWTNLRVHVWLYGLLFLI